METRRTTALSELDTSYRMGRGISAEGYAAKKQEIESTAASELAELQAGPTYKMLRENFEANRGGLRPVTQMVDGKMTTIYPLNRAAGRMMTESEWTEYEKEANANRAQTMEEFYGTAQTTGSIIEEGAPSPKRGPDTPRPVDEGQGFGLLEREKRSWYFV